MTAPARYHPALVALHWAIALLVIAALATGTFQLAQMPNDAPGKIDALRAHMITGISILLLTIGRLVVRLATRHPAPAATGHPVADRLAAPAHWALYLLVFLMAGSGIGIALLAGLPDIVVGGTGALPESFRSLAPRQVHGIVAKILMGLVALHVLAALYHQFVRRDGLLGRMWFGRR